MSVCQSPLHRLLPIANSANHRQPFYDMTCSPLLLAIDYLCFAHNHLHCVQSVRSLLLLPQTKCRKGKIAFASPPCFTSYGLIGDEVCPRTNTWTTGEKESEPIKPCRSQQRAHKERIQMLTNDPLHNCRLCSRHRRRSSLPSPRRVIESKKSLVFCRIKFTGMPASTQWGTATIQLRRPPFARGCQCGATWRPN